MPDCSSNKIFVNITGWINRIMLAMFLPVMFCVLFLGNKMDYFDGVKADILVPNAVLTLSALIFSGIALWGLSRGKKVRAGKRTARSVRLELAGLFTVFFLFCLMISGETVFDMAVDQGIVRNTAIEIAHGIPLGYRYEFSIDYNNLPITYILGLLYRFAEHQIWFGHNPEYLWVIVGCLMVTAAGFCCCEMVRKLTNNPAAVRMTFVLYLLTAGICPWKYIPYTDSYVILFPVLCLLLYLYSRDRRSMAGRLVLCFLACFSGAVGGLIKPNANIAVLAVLGMEGVDFLTAVIWRLKNRKGIMEEDKGKHRICFAGVSLLLNLLFACALYGGADLYMEHIIRETGHIYNEELEKTPQYIFFMGTNELTTGSFTIEDYGVFGEFQDSKADRNAACLERAWERIRERGPVGTLYFCLKKLVKSFNDGSFAWTDVRYYEPFPEDLTHNNAAADFLRSLFMPEGARQAWYDTFAELVWIFILLGVPGMVLEKENRGQYSVFAVFIIGLLLYLMLFESGARYLYIFLPVFVAVSVCGMELMSTALAEFCASGKKRLRGRDQ